MKKLTRNQYLAASLLVGLLAGLLLRFSLISSEPLLVESTPTNAAPTLTKESVTITPTKSDLTPMPFTTIDGIWLVNVRFAKNDPPKILDVLLLDSGRVSVVPSGKYQLIVLDENENILYLLKFNVIFMKGEPLHNVDEVELLFSIPAIEDSHLIKVESEYGSDKWEIKQ